ncbi:hypothetical protein ACUM5Y_06430 [Marinomonas dokdonensis]|uniref:hypothetical protein n=1 Tax=Marinomonas dokdonensis TaxID=328224 RepID=UPI004055835D
MKNIYSLVHPLNPAFDPIIDIIMNETARLGISYFITGATARDLLLFHVFGREPGRKTYDIDTAIWVEDWESFDAVRNALLAAGLKETTISHRLMHEASGLPIDIIPFGLIANQAGDIQWPPEHAITMSVSGFQEAFDHAVLIDIGKSSHLNVSSLAGLVLLKLLAWQERMNETNKDAADFIKIVFEYSSVELDRLYEEFIPVESLGYNPDRLGAFLLGYDLNMLLQHPNTHLKTLNQLREIEGAEPLLLKSLLKVKNAYSADEKEQLLTDFWRGVNLKAIKKG